MVGAALRQYCGTNPVQRVDPAGLIFNTAVAGVIAKEGGPLLAGEIFAGPAGAAVVGTGEALVEASELGDAMWRLGYTAGSALSCDVADLFRDLSSGRQRAALGRATEICIARKFIKAGFGVDTKPNSIKINGKVRKPDLGIYDKEGTFLYYVEVKYNSSCRSRSQKLLDDELFLGEDIYTLELVVRPKDLWKN